MPLGEFLGGCGHSALRLAAEPELVDQVLVLWIDHITAQPGQVS
ncbi:hypothetical protein AB0F96_21485 [Streptomyces sp. NPDC023998]